MRKRLAGSKLTLTPLLYMNIIIDVVELYRCSSAEILEDKMNIAAYCRVSTDKTDQLNSLETQKKFFQEYTEKNHHYLVKMYADEGISGTKTKNRQQFQQMIRDAERGMFELVVVKDISRFARNTVDLLNNIRHLKSLNINTVFITSNMESMENSEFVLTIFGALAQEESANMSKRVKFGKKENAKRGRVPNIVYGYDKTKEDYFNLQINETEANIVRQIYNWYVNDNYGSLKIANLLNERGYRTKRNAKFSQNGIVRILKNKIYTGKIVNGKEEVKDFLTGVREKKDEKDWLVTEKPELRIISDETYELAQQILTGRYDSFNLTTKRSNNRYLFSTLIECKDCGWSFRRVVKTYKNTYVRWVCSGHNRGAGSCPNAVTVDEDELISVIDEYLKKTIEKKQNIINYVLSEFKKKYKAKNENEQYEKELKRSIEKLKHQRQKYMDLYVSDLISKDDLAQKISPMKDEIERLERNLKLAQANITKAEKLEEVLGDTFNTLDSFTSVRYMTNARLKQIIQKIEVDSQGNVDIYLRLFGDFGFGQNVLIEQKSTDKINLESVTSCNIST